MTRRLLTAALVPVLLLVPAACSGGDEGARSELSNPRPSSTDPSLDEGRVSPADLPTAPVLEGGTGARGDLAAAECDAAAGVQAVAGELTNSGDAAADYVVVVSWTTATSDVVARGVATVEDLAPGAARSVEVTAEVPSGATACTVNVRRAPVAG
ncbi:FxLYD domain-containing protein [Nocardioides zeae]|uniref:Ig-like domain-containing protein n=1 Tax=Nocardioides zeae TaxID=1457234 RepID=A0AAJ1U1F6_9ACTN|nr:FxLYD domain-containing protein [Nocardioides zeae]MDQ1105614.1 hypothetical protein [Nocardioides zeae]